MFPTHTHIHIYIYCATAIIKCCLYVCCYQNVTNGNTWILYCIVLSLFVPYIHLVYYFESWCLLLLVLLMILFARVYCVNVDDWYCPNRLSIYIASLLYVTHNVSYSYISFNSDTILSVTTSWSIDHDMYLYNVYMK